MAKKRTDSLAGEEIIEARLAFVRECVARGLGNVDIVDECRKHELFKTGRSRPAGTGKRETYIARAVINEHYLCEVRKRMRATRYTGEEEIVIAYDQLALVVQRAIESDQLQAATGARKEMNKMLGLRRPDQQPVTTDVDSLVGQMRDMMKTVGVPRPEKRNGKAKRKKVARRKKAKQ